MGNYIKSEIINHWLPHFEIKSGEVIDDAIERVRMHAWTHHANRNIQKRTKKYLKITQNLLRRKRELTLHKEALVMY